MAGEPKTEIKIQSRSGLPFSFPNGLVIGGRRLNAENISTIKSLDGLTIGISAFNCGGFEFNGGTLTLVPSGVWYVGVELSSKELRALPRLGHRGWIPVAKVTTNGLRITDFSEIVPELPKCRIPRTMRKLNAGKSIKALIMGSSLTEGSSSTNWTGMIFGGALDKYGLPNGPTFVNIGLGGTPNAYQLCQLGFATSFSGSSYTDACYPNALTGKKPPNGRSTIFADIDVVVIGLLANGGDYRLENIEPLIRNLRKQNVEVIVTTDNSQNPSTVFSTMSSSALYYDGPEAMRVADLYGVELADTAAYVFEAHMRKGGVGIFADTIHMSSANPAGPTSVAPSSGHESWARAIRSVFPLNAVFGQAANTTSTYNFNDGTTQNWYAYNGANTLVTNPGNSLLITKNTAISNQWGGQVASLTVNPGDTVVVSGNITYDTGVWGLAKPAIGLQGGGGGWGSNSEVVNNGPFSVTLTAIRFASNSTVLAFANWDAAPNGSNFTLDNISITVNNIPVAAVVDNAPTRGYEITPLPNSRIVTDFKTPGDAVIILPADEYNVVVSTGVKGTLGAHPAGAGSFARRFNSQVSPTGDLLTLVTGQKVTIPAFAVVGFSLILYSINGSAQSTFDVHTNNNLRKSVTVAAQTLSREIYLPVMSPAEINNTSANLHNETIDITCTSGTLRIAAMVILTAEHEFIDIDQASRTGTWTASKVGGGAPGMPGYASDVLGSYMSFKCPENARRVGWIVSSKAVSKMVSTWSGQTSSLNANNVGVNHIKVLGKHIGRGELHYIQLAENAGSAGDSTNGYALHVGGIIVTYDR